MVVTADEVLKHLEAIGPALPMQIAKKIGKDSMTASAYLSELKARGKIKISNLKVGGSPLYYTPAQDAKLQNFVSSLNSHEKAVFDLLKQKQVIQDNTLPTVQRVAIRSIKDFALPQNLQVQGVDTLFWRWYLCSEEEFSDKVISVIGIKREVEEINSSRPIVINQTPSNTVVPQNVQQQVDNIKPIQETLKPLKVEEPVKQSKIEEPVKVIPKPKTITKLNIEEEISTSQEVKVYESDEENSEDSSIMKQVIKSKSKDLSNADHLSSSDFFKSVKKYLEKNKITVISQSLIKKNTEIDLEIMVPTVFGSMKYYLKAKNKKRCNDLDLSAVFVQSKMKELPSIFLIPGDLTKKASDMLGNEFKNIKYVRLE